MQTISIIVSLYILYMFNYFKTTISFAHPLTYFNNKYLYHPIINTDEETNMICKFGQHASWVIALFLILRFYLIEKKNFKNYSLLVYISIVIGSFLNLNAVIYLIPYFLIEMYLIFYFSNNY
jgi:hypothetical protein